MNMFDKVLINSSSFLAKRDQSQFSIQRNAFRFALFNRYT